MSFDSISIRSISLCVRCDGDGERVLAAIRRKAQTLALRERRRATRYLDSRLDPRELNTSSLALTPSRASMMLTSSMMSSMMSSASSASSSSASSARRTLTTTSLARTSPPRLSLERRARSPHCGRNVTSRERAAGARARRPFLFYSRSRAFYVHPNDSMRSRSISSHRVRSRCIRFHVHAIESIDVHAIEFTSIPRASRLNRIDRCHRRSRSSLAVDVVEGHASNARKRSRGRCRRRRRASRASLQGDRERTKER